MKVTIDENSCIGCGLCTGIAPEVFELNIDGKAEATGSCEGWETAVQEAVDSCPVSAINKEE